MDPTDGQDQAPEELAVDQARRERIERERAEQAPDERDAREHERRADKAGYLREKLEERVESEREAGG